jgi:hypothetical protein
MATTYLGANNNEPKDLLVTSTIEIRLFAECQMICRAFFLTTRQRSSLPSAKQKTIGKKNTPQRNSLPSFYFLYSTKSFFAECFIFDTRQRVSLTSVLFWTLGKHNLKITF